jgi:hypothetical protein
LGAKGVVSNGVIYCGPGFPWKCKAFYSTAQILGVVQSREHRTARNETRRH